jgi:hypothetical protein
MTRASRSAARRRSQARHSRPTSSPVSRCAVAPRP